MPFKLKRRQFPVRLAFAMTINKAQGQTMQRMGLFLPLVVPMYSRMASSMLHFRVWAQHGKPLSLP